MSNQTLLAALASPLRNEAPRQQLAMAASAGDEATALAAGIRALRLDSDDSSRSSSSRSSSDYAARARDKEDFGTATSYTVPFDGRMESLRVLITEGKEAASEGRLAAALRNYETAMVTLPEAYKPRLRKKIAKLEAQLDDEEERTPARPSRRGREAARVAEADLGPVDLLQIAVHDMNMLAAADAVGRTSGALSSSSSSWRSSPLIRECHAREQRVGQGIHISEGTYSPRFQRQDEGQDADGFEDKITTGGVAWLKSPAVSRQNNKKREGYSSGSATCSPTESNEQSIPTAVIVEQGSGDDNEGEKDVEDGSCCVGGPGSSLNWGHFGLGEGDGESAAVPGTDNQERLRSLNKNLSNKLEQQVVDIMNTATRDELMELHGIGLQRATRIIQHRTSNPFKALADLGRIGMFPKQIEKMGKHNMLECLDVSASRNT